MCCQTVGEKTVINNWPFLAGLLSPRTDDRRECVVSSWNLFEWRIMWPWECNILSITVENTNIQRITCYPKKGTCYFFSVDIRIMEEKLNIMTGQCLALRFQNPKYNSPKSSSEFSRCRVWLSDLKLPALTTSVSSQHTLSQWYWHCCSGHFFSYLSATFSHIVLNRYCRERLCTDVYLQWNSCLFLGIFSLYLGIYDIWNWQFFKISLHSIGNS